MNWSKLFDLVLVESEFLKREDVIVTYIIVAPFYV